MNQYVYHNKHSFFNDPYDSVFGISLNAFFGAFLSQFVDLNVYRQISDVLNKSKNIKNIDDVFTIIDELDINVETKEFIKFIFISSFETLNSSESKDMTEMLNVFKQKIIDNPMPYIKFLKSFYSSNLDEGKIKQQFKELGNKIESNSLQNLAIDPLSPDAQQFSGLAKSLGLIDEANKFERTLTDSVKNLNDKIFNIIDNQFGVASLTTSFNNPLMWSHYANSHKGICIEYDLSEELKNVESLKSLLIPVRYSNERVTIDYTLMDKIDSNNIVAKGKNDILKFFISGLYTKHDVWKYEDEWRSIIPVKQGNRNIQLGKISALYLGNKMEEATTNMIINLINKSNNGLDEISIFKMVNDISDYKLNPVQIK
ncbi:MAG TPA: DUF2971 domain-containing protein [Gallicola sp.]|nr:DUF2971 domain-containing protein [Gallicola sp.]